MLKILYKKDLIFYYRSDKAVPDSGFKVNVVSVITRHREKINKKNNHFCPPARYFVEPISADVIFLRQIALEEVAKL